MKLARFIVFGFLRLVYRLDVLHSERLPREGGALLLANHVTWLDAFLLSAASPRPVRFMIYSDFLKSRSIRWLLNWTGVIPVSPKEARKSIRLAVEAIEQGDIVCLFPEGQLTRTGLINPLQRGFQHIAKRVDAPVIPVYLHGLWGSIFSFARGRFFSKLPHSLPYPAKFAFGEALPKDADATTLRLAFQHLSAETLERQVAQDPPLAESLLKNLRKRSKAPCLIEYGKSRRELSRQQVLAIATSLARRWRSTLPADEDRIGVLLPRGSAAVFVRLALWLSGKTPVILPLQSTGAQVGLDSLWLARILNHLKVRTVVTSQALAPALSGFPWEGGEGQFVDMGGELRSAGTLGVGVERALIRFEPHWMAQRRYRRDFPRVFTSDRDRETSILVSARKTSEVGTNPPEDAEHLEQALSHQSADQIRAQIFQLSQLNFLCRDQVLFNEADPNTAEGSLFSFWIPLQMRAHWVGRTPAGVVAMPSAQPLLETEEVTVAAFSPRPSSRSSGTEAPEWKDLTGGRETVALKLILGVHALAPANEGPVAIGAACFDSTSGALLSLSVPDHRSPDERQSTQIGCREGSLGYLLPGFAPPSPPEKTWPREEPASDNALSLASFSAPFPEPSGAALSAFGEEFRGLKLDKNGFIRPDSTPPSGK